MEFKVGDRVRIIDNAEEYFGLVGKIESKIMDFMGATYYKVDIGEEFPYAFGGSQLEICVEKEEEIEEIEENKKLIMLDELLERIEKLEKEVFKPVEIHDRPKETKSSLLTEDERVILRNLDKGWGWIARDLDGTLCIYSEVVKPFKDKGCEFWKNGRNSYEFLIFKHLFQFIKWTDKEPYNIEELLKGECGNE